MYFKYAVVIDVETTSEIRIAIHRCEGKSRFGAFVWWKWRQIMESRILALFALDKNGKSPTNWAHSRVPLIRYCNYRLINLVNLFWFVEGASFLPRTMLKLHRRTTKDRCKCSDKWSKSLIIIGSFRLRKILNLVFTSSAFLLPNRWTFIVWLWPTCNDPFPTFSRNAELVFCFLSRPCHSIGETRWKTCICYDCNWPHSKLSLALNKKMNMKCSTAIGTQDWAPRIGLVY